MQGCGISGQQEAENHPSSCTGALLISSWFFLRLTRKRNVSLIPPSKIRRILPGIECTRGMMPKNTRTRRLSLQLSTSSYFEYIFSCLAPAHMYTHTTHITCYLRPSIAQTDVLEPHSGLRTTISRHENVAHPNGALGCQKARGRGDARRAANPSIFYRPQRETHNTTKLKLLALAMWLPFTAVDSIKSTASRLLC